MLRNRWRLIFMGLISILFVAGIFSTAVLALDGKAGEVIKTVQDLEELQGKGLLTESQVLAYRDLISKFNRSIPIVATTDRRLEVTGRAFARFTEKNKGMAKIGPDDNIVNYAGQGIPFPDLSPGDPQAGIKVAWNYNYKHEADNQLMRFSYWLTDSKGNVKKLRGEWYKLKFNYRTDLDPRPTLAGASKEIYFKSLYHFKEPFASKGLTQLTITYTDNARLQDSWVYVPGLRRIARIGQGNRCDCLGGFIFNYDDNAMFEGNYLQFNWKVLKVQDLLVYTLTPYNQPFEYIPGAHTLAPIFERRKVWVVEQTSKDPDYCYSKRVLYFDPEGWFILASDIYDRKGELWKYIAAPYTLGPFKTPSGETDRVIMLCGVDSLDFKIKEGGPSRTRPVANDPNMSPGIFTLDNLRRWGR